MRVKFRDQHVETCRDKPGHDGVAGWPSPAMTEWSDLRSAETPK